MTHGSRVQYFDEGSVTAYVKRIRIDAAAGPAEIKYLYKWHGYRISRDNYLMEAATGSAKTNIQWTRLLDLQNIDAATGSK